MPTRPITQGLASIFARGRCLLGVPMHRALRTMAAARATRLRRAARLLALATSRHIAVTARVGEHISARTHDSDQHHCGECSKSYFFHCLPLRASSVALPATALSHRATLTAKPPVYPAAVAQKAHDALG
jgi:hypothetical protein